MFFVYILESLKDGSYYKGYTENIEKRVEEHNLGKSKYTSSKTPWKLVYLREYASKTEALKEEKRLKKLNKKSIQRLIG
jgi:putative endonuclease